MNLALVLLSVCAVQWQHPAGMITDDTLAEVREKVAHHEWARKLYEGRKRRAEAWADLPEEELRRIFPRVGGNVYHNFSCPKDRVQLNFDPFNPDAFTCPTCNETFAPDTNAGIYPEDDRYHGDMYAGWICLFHLTASQTAVEMALAGRIDGDGRLLERAIDMLLLYAETLRDIPLRAAQDLDPEHPMFRQYGRILTYHREGDNKILFELAQTYELVRDRMTPAQRAEVERDVILRLVDDIMLEPYYVYDHNNIYQWHRTVVQAGLTLEREDLIDWAFGFGEYSREKLPEHRSMARILDEHFHPDGAFWELCSGYHLYPMNHLCQFAVLSHNLAAMDPERFPPARYDLTRRDSAGGRVIHNALSWFISMAMPDRTMTVVGDATGARSGMENYPSTAEIGYQYYGIKAVGDYPRYREGGRSWDGLLYGAPEIVQHETPFASSFLSSGWVSLRNEWEGNRLWVGLNSMIKGGGHQHADRLTLTTYSHGELLALEKSTPYNDLALRPVGTLTPAHNTVTVDFESQPQGEALTPEQTPEVVLFHAGPGVQFAAIHGDGLYPQTTVYRRAVAVVEDIVIDLFRVEGGQTHDWIVNHAGGAPEVSLAMEPGAFAPEEWLLGGTDRVRTAVAGDTWNAQWAVDGVTSRLTMLGAPETQVYALETYPLNNAKITGAYPPTQTLCVRRTKHAPFLAVWDAWRGEANLRKIEPARDRQDALTVHTQSHTYHVAFGPGAVTFADGTQVETDAAFTLLRDREALTLVQGARLAISAPGGAGTINLEAPATVSITATPDGPKATVSGPIAHDTWGGEDHPRPAPAVTPVIEGDWFVAQTEQVKFTLRRPPTPRPGRGLVLPVRPER